MCAFERSEKGMEFIMNKLSKILLTLVILLTIAVIIMIILFFYMKNLAYYNYAMYDSQRNVSNILEMQLEDYKQEYLQKNNQE